jgi:PAS domain-containing protein
LPTSFVFERNVIRMCARGIQIMAHRKLQETQAEFLLVSRELQESKARLEEAQRVAHVGYWIWNLETDRVTFSDETYRIFGLMPQEGPMDLAKVRELIHPEDREAVFRPRARKAAPVRG